MENIKDGFIKGFKEKFVSEKRYIYLFSFFIPIFVLSCIYVAKGVYPFGDVMYLARDMYHQYAPFFSEFYNKLSAGESLTYSWNIGLGTNFTGLYAYYLSSPFNWFLPLVNRQYLIEVMNIIIIIKIAMSSVATTYYLRHHYKSKDLATIAISVFYALSAYIAAYSWNIMWLDCVMLLPIIILGLERLVKYNKGYLYCISLGLAIISNYYIAYMICIYLVLYFIVLLFTNKAKKDWNYFQQRIINFAVFSLIAGAFAAFLIIPEYFVLKASASADISLPDTINRYFSIYEIFSRGLMNLEVSETTANDPNIYSSIIIFLLLPLYWMNSSKKNKEKVGKTLLLVFFLLSFNFNILNYFWHGFHFPNSLPARQSFIYIFLILTMAYEALISINKFKKKQIYGAFAFSIVLILSYEHLLLDEASDFKHIYISILFLSLYLMVIQIYRKVSKEADIEFYYIHNEGEDKQDDYEYDYREFKKTTVALVFLLITTAEALVNFGGTGISATSRSYYVDDNADINELLTRVEDQDESFYRIEKNKRRTKNDAAWHGYKGVSLFSSTSREKLNDYLEELGFESSMNALSFYGHTPLTSSLFSVKYVLVKEEEDSKLKDSVLNSLIGQSGSEYLYENNYTLPLGFMLPHDFDLKWDTSSEDPFIGQNDFSSNLLEGNLFNEITKIYNDTMIMLKIEDYNDVYIYVPTSDVESLNVSVADENGIEMSSEIYDDYDREYIINIGSFEPGNYVHITTPESISGLEVYAYSFDEGVYINLYNKLINESFNIDSFEDTYIRGSINASEKGLMYTSIPYDEGWSVKVDGSEIEPIAFKEALLSIPLEAGQHSIELSYTPQGLKLGIGISLMSILSFIIVVIRDRYKKRLYK